MINEATASSSRPDDIPHVNSLFEQPWWLDAVAPGQWHEILVRRGEELLLRFPYVLEKKNGFVSLLMPGVTQAWAPGLNLCRENIRANWHCKRN